MKHMQTQARHLHLSLVVTNPTAKLARTRGHFYNPEFLLATGSVMLVGAEVAGSKSFRSSKG